MGDGEEFSPESYANHVREVAQKAGDVIHKQYKLVNEAECNRIGRVNSEGTGTCQVVNFKSTFNNEPVLGGKYDDDTRQVVVHPDHPGWYRDQVLLHEINHSLGIEHSMIEGDLMKQGGNASA